MACIVEIWELTGDRRTVCTPACLTCGWVGDGGSRAQADAAGWLHERGGSPARQPAPLIQGSGLCARAGTVRRADLVSRSSRIGEAENRLRFALDRRDADGALAAARFHLKFQGRDDLALDTVLRLAVLLARRGHPLAERATARWIERAQDEAVDWQLVVVAEAALDGLGVPAIEGACARILEAVARGYERTPVPAS